MAKIVRLPGLVDIHVHFRDPGETHKEDFYTGTLSALANGVTTVFDMPNNLTPVFTEEVLQNKITIARQKAVCDWGLYFGSTGDNLAEFAKVADKVVGLKVYLSLTTGKYVVGDEDKIKAIFASWPKEKVIVFHAEGDRVDLVIKYTEKFGNKVHITHVSTEADLEKIIAAKKNKLSITCDVTPHHLFLTEGDCPCNGETVPNLYFVKPPLASQKDQDFLWQNLTFIDCLSPDRAPHLRKKKQSPRPPAGLPGLDTLLPLMMTAVSQGRLSLNQLIQLTSVSPAKIFSLSQNDSTFVEVDPEEEYQIDNHKLLTKCGWSPFDDWLVKGKVKRVYLRGRKVFEKGQLLVDSGYGKNVI